MRLIDADELLEHKCAGVEYDRAIDDGIKKTDDAIFAFKCGWNDALQSVADFAPTIDAVPTKALRLFIEWADECGFGYDNIPDEYEKYKDDIKDMGWIEGFMYIVLKEAEMDEVTE